MQSLGFNIVGLSSRVQNFWMWTVGLQTTVASEQYAAGQARPRRPAEGGSRQAAATSNRQSAPDQLRFCPGSRPAVRGCGSLWRQPCLLLPASERTRSLARGTSCASCPRTGIGHRCTTRSSHCGTCSSRRTCWAQCPFGCRTSCSTSCRARQPMTPACATWTCWKKGSFSS